MKNPAVHRYANTVMQSRTKANTAKMSEPTRQKSSIEILELLTDLRKRVARWQAFDWEAAPPADDGIATIRAAVDALSCTVEETLAHAGRAPDARSTPDLAAASVLLVEDNTVNRMVAEGMLQQFHCKVDMAANGAEALRCFTESDYDLVFMDCQMPVMDGFEAVSKIRELESRDGGRRRTPIVALTANALKGDRDQCIAAGMDDYVSKPFCVDDLRNALERQLGSSRTQQIRALRERDIEMLEATAGSIVEVNEYLDVSVLEAIQKLTRTNGEQLLGRVIDVFLESTPKLVGDLDTALADRDCRQVKTAAHALRSCCGSVGATQLASISRSIEELDEERLAIGADEWREQLAQCVEATRLALERRRPAADVA